MPSVVMVDQKNNKVKDVELPELFATEVRTHLVHSAVKSQLANKRAGTAATKNKALNKSQVKGRQRIKGVRAVDRCN